MRTPRSLAGVLLAACIASFVVPAAGAPSNDDDVVTGQVTLDDLDLSLPSDQAKLRLRIRSAARTVCTDLVAGSGFGNPNFADCLNYAMQNGLKRAGDLIAAARKQSQFAAGTPK